MSTLKRYSKRALSLALAIIMALSCVPFSAMAAGEEPHDHAAETAAVAATPLLERLRCDINILPGQLVPEDLTVTDSEVYGHIVGYELKKGHTLAISNTDYVFSVRQLVDGNYTTMLKQATSASFTATEDMTVACLVRKPDKSAVTAEELAVVKLQDILFAMSNVEGSVHRFTVEAETINGGTQTTRAAIFLPTATAKPARPPA